MRFCNGCTNIHMGICIYGHWPMNIPQIGHYNEDENIVVYRVSWPWEWMVGWTEVILRPPSCPSYNSVEQLQ